MRYLNHVNKSPAKIRNVDKEFPKQHDFKCIKFPVLKRDYAKIEN